MRKVVHKFIPVWKMEEEEKWLNAMAAEGWCLIAVSFCRYEFEACEKGEYTLRMELLEKHCEQAESLQYIRFMEETGAEQVGCWMRWAYFRKKRADGEFELYSDRPSRLKMKKRLLQLLTIVGAGNLYIGLYNVWLLCCNHVWINALGLINLGIAAMCVWGFCKLYRDYKRMKAEGLLFE